MSLSRTLGTLPLGTLLALLTLGLIPGPSSIAGAADESFIPPSIGNARRFTRLAVEELLPLGGLQGKGAGPTSRPGVAIKLKSCGRGGAKQTPKKCNAVQAALNGHP